MIFKPSTYQGIYENRIELCNGRYKIQGSKLMTHPVSSVSVLELEFHCHVLMYKDLLFSM